MEKKSPLTKKKDCILCRRIDDDELLFGKFFHRYTLSVHHNCLFFSSGLVQRSRPNRSGILGFLFSDIQAEAARGKKLKCSYCKRVGATIGCVVGTCKKVFHFPCGVQHQSLHQYFGSFSSYCELHKPKQNNVLSKKEDLYCYICFTSIHQNRLNECLYSPCCKNNWFHRNCLQQYAWSAGGHFFKCPLCNNANQFIQTMLQMGIHIPNKDAEWELENNAFQELYSRPGCDSSVCKCLKGKDHDGYGGWKLLSCCMCGSRATHRYCGGLDKVKSWICSDCSELQTEMESRKKEALTYTCDPRLLHELLRRRPIVKLLIDESLFLRYS